MLAFILFVLAISGSLGAGLSPASMIAHLDSARIEGNPGHDVELISQLRLKSGTVMAPFAELLSKLAHTTKTVCDTESSYRFTKVSRSLENSLHNDNQHHATLEGVRAVYAIRKAFCETRVTNSQIPSPCRTIVVSSNLEQSVADMVKKEIDLALSSAVSSCLCAFRGHHYLWTSYSNHRQDANAMTQLLRSDVEMIDILATYRDVLVHLEKFGDYIAEFEANFVTSLKDMSGVVTTHVDESQAVLASFERDLANLTTKTTGSMEMMANNITSLLQILKLADQNVLDVQNMIQVTAEGVTSMRTSIGSLYNEAALDLVDNVRNGYEGVRSVEQSMLRDLGQLAESFDMVIKNFTSFNEYSAQLFSQQLGIIQNSTVVSQMTLDTLHEMDSLTTNTLSDIHEIQGAARSLSKDIATLTYIFTQVGQHSNAVYAIFLFLILSVALAPFEGTFLSTAVTTRIKKLYWAVQAIFYLGRATLPSLKGVQPTDVAHLSALLAVLLVVSFLVTRWSRLLCKPTVNGHGDIKRNNQNEPHYPPRKHHRSERQRQRLEIIPRSVRHATAPPGL